MVLFVLRKIILRRRMRNHPVGLDVWFLVGPFVYFHTSCVRTAKALVRLRKWAGSPDSRSLAWAFVGRLCDKYHNLMSWLKSISWKTHSVCDCSEYIFSDSTGCVPRVHRICLPLGTHLLLFRLETAHLQDCPAHSLVPVLHTKYPRRVVVTPGIRSGPLRTLITTDFYCVE